MTSAPIDAARVVSEIRRILVEDLGVPAGRIEGAPRDVLLLGRGVGLDSMEALTLVTALERALTFEAIDEEMTAETFASLDSLAGRVTSWIARQGPA